MPQAGARWWRAGLYVPAQADRFDDAVAGAVETVDVGLLRRWLSVAACEGLWSPVFDSAASFLAQIHARAGDGDGAAAAEARRLRRAVAASKRDVAMVAGARASLRVCVDPARLAPKSKRKRALSWAFSQARASPQGATTTLSAHQRVMAMRLWRHCIPMIAAAAHTVHFVLVAINELHELLAPRCVDGRLSATMAEADAAVRAETGAPPKTRIVAEATDDMVDEVYYQLAERLLEAPPPTPRRGGSSQLHQRWLRLAHL